ncbi:MULTISPECIES: hypothetical protein [unclassified Leucobacter]|uniref:hypothetical protein n=1 Tax=unclassified Leucobacter TaxID=2621730 RepID=UPI0012E07C2C|nr:hypothetical protein [Leucobacter sp. Ag1]
MQILGTVTSPDVFQLLSGFLGALLSGLVMVLVLIVTLRVQTRQHREQLEAQRKQFLEQRDANEALLRKQLDLERTDATHREILRLRFNVVIAILDLERIATTHLDRDKYAARRYEILALNRAIMSHLQASRRAEYSRIIDLHDRVAITLAQRVNAGIPTGADYAAEHGKLAGLLEAWIDAYVAGNDEEGFAVNEKVRRSHESLDAV